MKVVLTGLVSLFAFIGASDGVDTANRAVSGVSISTLLYVVIGSSTLTTAVSFWLFRRKHTADAVKTEAEADNIVAKTYNQVLADLRAELTREQESSARRIAQVEDDCNRRIAQVEEENRQKYVSVIDRVSFLEQREEQATTHIKNLEKMLREVGVPLPPTPWRPITLRRKKNGSS